VGVYDQFAYPGYAYAATHPARLEVIGRLFGLRPRSAVSSRVLEIGCGDGGNALSLAQTLPEATVVGIDASAGAIARGGELAAAAGIENLQLHCLDLQTLPEDLGVFDYIVSHGVYSWITPRARVALLAGIRRHLAPEGIAYVSYNAYPGSYLRDMARDILRYHLRDTSDPQQKLAQAHELMATIVAIESPSPYAQVLRQHMERMLNYPDALLFHDDLAEISTPFYFHEFMEHATHQQLAFLSEADLFESQMRDVPDSAEELMGRLPDDVLVREQYLDFFKNRMFRQTLLCHIDAPVTRQLEDSQIEHFAISSRASRTEQNPATDERPEHDEQPPSETFITPGGFSMSTSEPHVQAVMHALGAAWPQTLDFAELLSIASDAAPQAPRELVATRLRGLLLEAYLARIVLFSAYPPPVVREAGERPRTSPLVRAQCAAGQPVVSSLLHLNVGLEGELEPRLLELLDGTREHRALAEELTLGAPELRQMLARFASVGLLES